MTWTTVLSSKGQIVLPKAARDRLGAKPGTKILVTEHDGRLELRAYGGDLRRWYGAAKVESPQDWQEVEAATQRARAAEVVRESQGS